MARRGRKGKISAKVGWQEIKRTILFLLRWLWRKFLLVLSYLNPFMYMRTRRRKYKLVLDRDGNLIYRPTVWEKMVSAFRSDATNRRKLLEWSQEQIPTFRVSDFCSTWSDGVALCALMEAVCPGACPRHDLLKPQHKVNNCRLGLKLAQKHLGITQNIVSPEEMANGNASSEIKMRKLINLIRWASERQTDSLGLQDLPDRPRLLRANSIVKMAASCTAKGTGLVVGIMGKRCKFNVYTNTAELLDLNIEIAGPKGERCSEKIMSLFPTKSMSQMLHKKEDLKITRSSLFRGLFFGKKRLLPLPIDARGTEEEAEDKTVEKIPFDYQCVADGHFLVSYIPRSAGEHMVTIKWQGADIKGSPYTVNIAESIEKLNEQAQALSGNKKVCFQEDKGDNKMSYYPSVSTDSGTEDDPDQGAQPATAAVLTRSSTVHRSLTTTGKVAMLAKQATVTRRRVLRRVITKAGQEIVIQEAAPSPSNSRQNSSESSTSSRNGGKHLQGQNGRAVPARAGSPPPRKKNRSFDFEVSYESDTSDSTSQASDSTRRAPHISKLTDGVVHAMAGIVMPDVFEGVRQSSESAKDTSSESEKNDKKQARSELKRLTSSMSTPALVNGHDAGQTLSPPMYDANFKASPFSFDVAASRARKTDERSEMHSNGHRKLTATRSSPVQRHVQNKPRTSLRQPLMPPMAEGRPASDSQLNKMRARMDINALRRTRSATSFTFSGGWIPQHSNGSLGVPSFQGVTSGNSHTPDSQVNPGAETEIVGKGGFDKDESGATTKVDEEGNHIVTIMAPVLCLSQKPHEKENDPETIHLRESDGNVRASETDAEPDKQDKAVSAKVNVRTQLRSSSDLNLHVKSSRVVRKDSVKKTLSDPSSRTRKSRTVARSNTSPSSPICDDDSRHLTRQISTSSTSTKGSDSPSIKVLQSDSLRKTCVYISQRAIVESMNTLRSQVSADFPSQTKAPEPLTRSFSVDNSNESTMTTNKPLLGRQVSRRHLRLSTSLPTLSRNWTAFEIDPDEDDSLSIEEMQAMSVAAQKKPKRYTLGTSDISDTLEQWQCMDNEEIKQNLSGYNESEGDHEYNVKNGTLTSPASSPGTSPSASRINSRRGSLVRQEVITLQKVSEEDSAEVDPTIDNKENRCPNAFSIPGNGSNTTESNIDWVRSGKVNNVRGNFMLTVSRAETQSRSIQIHAPKAKVNRATQVTKEEIMRETGWQKPEKYARSRRKFMRNEAVEGSSSLENCPQEAGASGDLKQNHRKVAGLPLIVYEKADSAAQPMEDQDGAANGQWPEEGNLLHHPVRQSTVDTIDSGIAEDHMLLSSAGSTSPRPSQDIQRKIPPKPRFISGHRAVMRKPYRGKIALDPKLIRNTCGSSSYDDDLDDSTRPAPRSRSPKKTTLVSSRYARSISDSGRKFKRRPASREDSGSMESDRSKGAKGRGGKDKKKRVMFSRRVLMYKRSSSRSYSRQSSSSRQSDSLKSPSISIENERNIFTDCASPVGINSKNMSQALTPDIGGIGAWSPTNSRASYETSSVDDNSSPWFSIANSGSNDLLGVKAANVAKGLPHANHDHMEHLTSDSDNTLIAGLPIFTGVPSADADKQLGRAHEHLEPAVMDHMDPADLLVVVDSHSSAEENYDGFGLTNERRTSLLDELSMFSNLATSRFDRTKSEEDDKNKLQRQSSMDKGYASWHHDPSSDSRGQDTHSGSETCSEVARLTGHYSREEENQQQSSVDDLMFGFSSNDELALGFSSNDEALGAHDPLSPTQNLFIPAGLEGGVGFGSPQAIENPLIAALGENYISFTGLLDTNGINRSMFDSGLGDLSDLDELLFLESRRAEPMVTSPEEPQDHQLEEERSAEDHYLSSLAYCGVPNPYRVKVYGAGLRYGLVGVQNNFQVQTDNAGNGSLTVGVTGPRPHTVTETSVTYTGDNMYEILYDVTEPGYYIITVKWSDFNVPESPFICKVTY